MTSGNVLGGGGVGTADRRAGLGGLAAASLTAALLMFAVVAQGLGPFAGSVLGASSTTATAPIVNRPAAPLALLPGGAGEIVLRFAPFTPASAAEHWAAPYGLELIAANPALGRYVFAVPQIHIDAISPDTAVVTFPSTSTAADVATYLTDNHLTVVRWVPASALRVLPGEQLPRSHTAIVQLPQVKLQLADAANGIWSAILPAHLDATRLNDWANANGLQVISYDPQTGALRVLVPGTALPAPLSTAAAQVAALQNALRSATGGTTYTP
ncbi:MAG TPA: hypothetical protein VIO86_00690, partial [Candidatus Dormibacteraeota bacterium]